MQSVIDSLQTALEMERKGRRFYLDAAERVQDQIVRSVLVALANDEEAHERMINGYYQAIRKQQDLPPVPDHSAEPPEHVTEILQSTAGSIGLDATFLSVYEVARDFEQKSRDFYQAQVDLANDRPIVDFYRFLVRMEQVHLQTLQLLLDATRSAAESR